MKQTLPDKLKPAPCPWQPPTTHTKTSFGEKETHPRRKVRDEGREKQMVNTCLTVNTFCHMEQRHCVEFPQKDRVTT